jgi:hypothetical protein
MGLPIGPSSFDALAAIPWVTAPRRPESPLLFLLTGTRGRLYTPDLTREGGLTMTNAWSAPEIEERSQVVAKLCQGGSGHGSGSWKPPVAT